MSSPLVDPEGFPRSDIDVAGVRTARAQIIRLRNDLKGIIEEMGGLLQRGLPRREPVVEGVAREEVVETVQVGREPFARVDSVARGSPAELAVRLFSSSPSRIHAFILMTRFVDRDSRN